MVVTSDQLSSATLSSAIILSKLFGVSLYSHLDDCRRPETTVIFTI